MATASDGHPTDGIRMILERESVTSDGAGASYRASIYTPTEVFHYRADLESGGAATLTAESDAASDDHEKRLRNLAKSTARAAPRKVDDGLPPWPERVTRWRGPGRG